MADHTGSLLFHYSGKANFCFGLLRGPAPVDGLNYLKGQIHPRNFFQGPIFIVFSWPDQCGLFDIFALGYQDKPWTTVLYLSAD